MLNDIREMIAQFRKLRGQVTVLQDNIQQLQRSMIGVNDFIDGVNKGVAKWQFKNAPRLARIQKIMDRFDNRK